MNYKSLSVHDQPKNKLTKIFKKKFTGTYKILVLSPKQKTQKTQKQNKILVLDKRLYHHAKLNKSHKKNKSTSYLFDAA